MSGFTDVLKAIAPTVATALGGPLAGAAMSFLSSKLGVDPALVEQTIAGMGPGDLVKLKELDYEFKEHMAELGIRIDLAQIDVNKTEAGSTNWWVAGWRPYVGWVCGTGLLYATIIDPLLRFVAKVMFAYAGVFPAIDTVLMLQVLIAILGVSALRTTEKVQGAEQNR